MDSGNQQPGDESGAPGRERRWRVLKFGGTSLATRERWESVERIARARMSDGVAVALVCSAIAGVTNLLTEIVAALRDGKPVARLVSQLREHHAELAGELGLSADALLADEYASLDALLARGAPTPAAEADIMAHGELMSTRLGAARLTERGVPCTWIDARELLTSEPQPAKPAEHYLSASCPCNPSPALRARLDGLGTQVIVTQGFIAHSPDDETVLLGRGGSDTSAAYLACLLSAERLEIWTDVPGLFTANPQLIPDARLLRRVGYREAQALGALGAKVIHPRALDAVWEHGVPVEIGWTEHPDIEGTSINATRPGTGIKAITSRPRLAVFMLRRPPSWQPVGFLADVAACFARHELSMDLVSSSCSEIRVTIDLGAFPWAEAEIPSILGELEAICQPRVVVPVASVSVVGESVTQALLGSDDAPGLFADEALFMIVHAANELHVSFVLDEHAAQQLVLAAHERLLGDGEHPDVGPTWTELTEQLRDAGGEAA